MPKLRRMCRALTSCSFKRLFPAFQISQWSGHEPQQHVLWQSSSRSRHFVTQVFRRTWKSRWKLPYHIQTQGSIESAYFYSHLHCREAVRPPHRLVHSPDRLSPQMEHCSMCFSRADYLRMLITVEKWSNHARSVLQDCLHSVTLVFHLRSNQPAISGLSTGINGMSVIASSSSP